MKQDIRDFFKDREDLKIPPANHRNEFLDKLKTQNKSKKRGYTWLKIVAVAIVALTVGFSIFYEKPVENVSPMLAQVEAVEEEYLKEINAEWENFVAIANDEVLVARFKKRLDALDRDYQSISKQFKSDVNNIVVVEALVDNLQTRLQILKDIQEHIKILNQKNEQNEKSI
ncbi:MAG: hypothetical protein ACX93I_06250 [Winogradskyella sp.]